MLTTNVTNKATIGKQMFMPSVIFLYISVRIKATVFGFIWAEREGPPVRLAYISE